MQAIERSGRLGLVMPVLQKVGQVLIILLLALLLRGFYRNTSKALSSHAATVTQRQAETVVSLSPMASEDQEYRNMQQQMRQLVAQRPAEMSAVIRAWLKEE
jgi:flagellar biosynthesis/type III secretory pathway M-ring protein FliF/YscJ